jgi:hypothetical protein
VGFFSYDCKGCGHPLMYGVYNMTRQNYWMVEAVMLQPKKKPVIGHYNGYGIIGGHDMNESHDYRRPEVYHRACWHALGKPKFKGPSNRSECQGGMTCDQEGDEYMDPHDHDQPEPSCLEDIERIRTKDWDDTMTPEEHTAEMKKYFEDRARRRQKAD